MNDPISLSICICTSGRQRELEQCLTSIAAGTRLPLEAIVGDDSKDSATSSAIRETCGRFEFARYVEGPRRGLCANRNKVIRLARGSHLSLLDDDGMVGKDFVEQAVQLADAEPSTILTGDVLEYGATLTTSNLTFLGYFGKTPTDGEPLRNIQLNCNVLPRRAFEGAQFDENIVYGYEDTDLCDQLIAAGWEIKRVRQLLNEHQPPPRTPEMLARQQVLTENARLYVGVRARKRGRRPIAALGWTVAALAHATASATVSRQPARALAALRGSIAAWRRPVQTQQIESATSGQSQTVSE